MSADSHTGKDIVSEAMGLLKAATEEFYERKGNRTMIGFVKLKSGYEILVSAHTKSPEEFDKEAARAVCRDKLLVEVVELIVSQGAVPSSRSDGGES